MRHNVTTPGGFFVGLGGIAAFCAVSAGVYFWVSKPAASTELEPQKTALGLVSKEKDKQAEINALLASASNDYNGGKEINLNNIDDLRGVVRHREAAKSAKDTELLTGKSNVEGKNVIEAAIAEVVKEIATKKPAASTVKIDLNAPAADAPLSMPNLQGRGTSTMTFPPIAAPVAPAAPAPETLEKPKTEAAPAPAPTTAPAPQAAVSTPVPAIAAVPAPNRPPLLNWSDSK
jgi:hypothetical protein